MQRFNAEIKFRGWVANIVVYRTSRSYSSTLVPRFGIDSRFVSLSDPYVVTSDDVLNVSESSSSSDNLVFESCFDVKSFDSVSGFGEVEFDVGFC